MTRPGGAGGLGPCGNLATEFRALRGSRGRGFQLSGVSGCETLTESRGAGAEVKELREVHSQPLGGFSLCLRPPCGLKLLLLPSGLHTHSSLHAGLTL